MNRSRFVIGLLAGVALSVGFSSAESQPAGAWRKIVEVPDLSFPRDHGSHPDTLMEWWYVTGVVNDEDGKPYGYQLTFFRRGLIPGAPGKEDSPLQARQVYSAHLAIADITEGKFPHAERRRREAAGLAGSATTHLNVWIENWSMKQDVDETIHLRAADPGEAIGLNLQLKPKKPLVLQGNGGLSQKGPEPGNASVYLTWMRMATVGVLRIGEREFRVSGESWVDHEYGSSQLGAGVVGWDWFGLRLDGDRELMLYQLRRKDGTATEFSSGTLVQADGTKVQLSVEDFKLETTNTWTSPHNAAVYPSAWSVSVPAHGIEFTARALVPDCEIDSSQTMGTIYWEGPVRIEGGVTGEGYAELTGYAVSLEGRF